MSTKAVAALLRSIDSVKKSPYLTADQKAVLISETQNEIAELVGQKTLPGLPPGGIAQGTPPAAAPPAGRAK